MRRIFRQMTALAADPYVLAAVSLVVLGRSMRRVVVELATIGDGLSTAAHHAAATLRQASAPGFIDLMQRAAPAAAGPVGVAEPAAEADAAPEGEAGEADGSATG